MRPARFPNRVLGVAALAVAAPTFGCPKAEPASAGVTAASDAPFAVAASVSAPPGSVPAIAKPFDGVHDYRGTLGKQTAIALHLVRTGKTLGGSYVYIAIGRSIALDGTVDAKGGLVLTEKVGGAITGAFHLRAAGDDLVGEWSNPAGSKTLPVRLASGAPWTGAPLEGGAPAETRSARAEECLSDPTCAASGAAQLFITGDDAHDHDADCLRFVDGSGTVKDVKRGRACLERSRTSGCDGSSADLWAAELAVLYIDGQGGKVNLAGARAVFAQCFDDATKEAVLAHAAAKERDPKTPAMDFCKDHGGTTLTTNSCLARDRTNEETRAELQAKVVAAGLDDAGKKLLGAAQMAYSRYADAMGTFAYQVFVEGSIRNAVALGRERELYAKWMAEMTDFPRFVAKDVSPADVERARADATRAVGAVSTSTPEEKEALLKTRDAWAAFRDADIALYEAAYGAVQGKDPVRAAITMRLESRRATECAPPSGR